jgi:hypothetical protein
MKEHAMNTRERFLEVMRFNRRVPPVKWEFGYWGGTINNWYAQGLPRKRYPEIPTQVTTPTSTLYTAAWTCQGTQTLPEGFPVMAGGLYWPTQGFALDYDVREHFGMDCTQVMVDVNLLFEPMFEVKVLRETDERFVYVDIDGVERIFMKQEATIPTTVRGPIDGWDSWRKLKAERLNTKDISRRFPKNWSQLVKEYKNRDYPLAIGGYPHGYFGTLAHLLGYEKLFYWYYDEPELLHDMLSTFTDVWLAVYEQVLSEVEVDHIHFWEDISAGKGPMVSLELVREFMLPYYKRMIDFLKARGMKIFFVDTDGDCNSLIPLFMSVGVTGMYPFETHCGMDIVKVRREYPTLQILGGVPKSEIAKGRQRIDEILRPVEAVLRTGGFVPFGDHFIPPEVPWEEFRYYRTKLNRMIDSVGE